LEALAVPKLSDAIDRAMQDALSAWRKQYAPGASYEEIVGLHLDELQVTLTMRYSWRTSVCVMIQAKDGHKSMAEYYDVIRAGGQERLYVDDSVAKPRR
jgi:hypothetical protein